MCSQESEPIDGIDKILIANFQKQWMEVIELICIQRRIIIKYLLALHYYRFV